MKDKDMFLPHPNLSDEINHNIIQSEIDGGVFLRAVDWAKKMLQVQTKNTLYQIKSNGGLDEDLPFFIKGNANFCPDWTRCSISGSTWGGYLLKLGFVGRGMHLEYSIPARGTITSTSILEITEVDL